MQVLSNQDALHPKLQFSVLQLASWPALCELAPDTKPSRCKRLNLLQRLPRSSGNARLRLMAQK